MKQFGWKKKIGFLLALAMVVGLSFGTLFSNEVCAADAAEGETVQKAQELHGASHFVSEDDITVTITTDKESYKSGEEIQYQISINNDKRFWSIQSGTIKYNHEEGLNVVGEELATKVPKISSGESLVLSGTLVGDETLFPPTGPSLGLIAIVVAVVIVVLLVILFLLKKKGKVAKATTALLLALVVLSQSMPVNAAAEKVTVTLRPYVRLQYAGQEVMLRAVMELELAQQIMNVPAENRVVYKKTTCHDPSIFRDVDGKYYIFGTHITGSSSDNLYDWTNLDTQVRAMFSEETREQIRAWNKDNHAGNWFDYLWAPDIIYNETMGKYCIYLSANGDDWKSNIVLLTAEDVMGPYEYAGSVVYGGFTDADYAKTDAPKVTGEQTIPQRYVTHGIENRRWGDMWPNCIDPCVFYDEEGKLWMAYGSWSGGIFMLELDEETGLRDYNVTYETNIHSDAYFGTKIAGGAYVSGEGAYIEKIGEYYYLFISYGNLEAAGGYNVRVFRSERPDGDYVDALGNTAYSDKYVFNYNLSQGVRLMGGYKWRTMSNGMVAQGHNSAFVDEDGKAYIVLHTRTANGTEGHYVKVHQLFVNKEGWLVAAPYQTTGETLSEKGLSVEQVAGEYEFIIHELEIDYKNLETKKSQFVNLNADGSITGEFEGTWKLEEGTPYITITVGGVDYSGVSLLMNMEFTNMETVAITAMGIQNQVTIWGSKVVDE
ncbi:MAG: glycoside hydrolase family 43 protein [Lachnospiraceae bacterium]|nr:glycoside hydrolase family 43 protein [Lachnospiraceae bacterium]